MLHYTNSRSLILIALSDSSTDVNVEKKRIGNIRSSDRKFKV